jgi:hypothetical protein
MEFRFWIAAARLNRVNQRGVEMKVVEETKEAEALRNPKSKI